MNTAQPAMKNIAVGNQPQPPAPMHAPLCHAAAAAAQGKGSGRRRLWALAHHCHCPLVGVSLPMETLRRLVNKALGGSAVAHDYEVHVGAVSECARRCKLSELMQTELDSRYAREIARFRSAKSTLALAQLWGQYLKAGDVAGAFWAALSHPRCDASLQEAMCRDLHMFQHQAGAGVRLEIAKFNALADENAVLARELGKVQERSNRLIGQKIADVERLNGLLVQARADAIAKDSRIAFLGQDLESLQASIPEWEDSQRLQKKVGQLTQRQWELESQNQELRRRLAALEKPEGRAQTVAPVDEVAAEERTPGEAPVVTIQLYRKMVLCVGGRSGNLANYRDAIERVGGRFSHHDGGLEHSATLLDANLAAADLVICQTGCISHNAYWRVKDFCKRTGKRCVFVENPSMSSLERGLAQIVESSGVVPEN